MNKEITKIWFEFNGELKSFIMKSGTSESDAKDILQDIFVKIIKNFDRVFKTEDIRQYLYAMVRNAVADFYKKSKNRNSKERPETEIFTQYQEEDLSSVIAECCVAPFINQLPPKYKEAIKLSELEKLPQTELAERLGISYSGAKSRVQRGREKLKELLLSCCKIEADTYGNFLDVENENCDC